mgnify:CR=1 FL=1
MSYCTLEEAWGSSFQNTNNNSVSVPSVSKKLAVPTSNLYNSDLNDGATFNGKYYGGNSSTRNVSNKRTKKHRVKDRRVTFDEVDITSKQNFPRKSKKSLKYIKNIRDIKRIAVFENHCEEFELLKNTEKIILIIKRKYKQNKKMTNRIKKLKEINKQVDIKMVHEIDIIFTGEGLSQLIKYGKQDKYLTLNEERIMHNI